MGIFAAIIMGMFVLVGGNQLLSTLVTGTTGGETVITSAVPIVLASVAVVVVIGIFK